LLQTLGLHAGITMTAHPMTLYVYVSGDALNDIMKIKKLVDFQDVNEVEPSTEPSEEDKTPGNDENKGDTNTDTDKDTDTDKNDGTTSDVVISDGETSLVKLTLQYINKDAAKSIISTFGYKVEVLGLDLYEKVLWLRGGTDAVNEAIEQIKQHDVSGNNTERVSFTYDLQNIVASELQNKISNMDIDGVEFYFGSYPELTKSIIVYCPANQVENVKNVIATLDSNLGKMYYPIATITSNEELQALATKEALVVKFLNNPGITVDSFIVSEDLDPTENVKYIVYVCESPENIDLISKMWSTIG
ncbi:MAG: hypothetical protein IJN49_03495, partial [Clostridia bacterium]|nr:hypothetical protein [Clostridia bacterium]